MNLLCTLIHFRSFLCPWGREVGVQFITEHSGGKLILLTSSKVVEFGVILIFISEENIFKIFVDL